MILVCGDLHGEREKLLQIVCENDLQKEDILLVMGDFGFCFYNTCSEEQQRRELSKLIPCTVLFVAGNHENHPVLASFPEEERWGGRVHRLEDNMFHLINGEVYDIMGKKCFVMGGAYSVDRAYREEPLWLWTKGEKAFLCSDLQSAPHLTADTRSVIKREDCYGLIKLLYDRLLPFTERYFPGFLAEYKTIREFNEDTKKIDRQKRIETLFRLTELTKYRHLAEPLALAAAAALKKEGGKDFRFLLKEGSWWKEELPSKEDYKRATENLKKTGGKFDYLFSHTMPREMILRYGRTPAAGDLELTGFLEWVMYEYDYEMHYCGHWHDDCMVGDRLTIVYNQTRRIL